MKWPENIFIICAATLTISFIHKQKNNCVNYPGFSLHSKLNSLSERISETKPFLLVYFCLLNRDIILELGNRGIHTYKCNAELI